MPLALKKNSVILFYDYLITFGDEVQLFWRRKWTGATVLFILNRYMRGVSGVAVGTDNTEGGREREQGRWVLMGKGVLASDEPLDVRGDGAE